MSDDDPAANASDVSVGDESEAPAADAPDDSPATARDASGDHVVYVLECADGTFYTGYTTDLERRVAEHEAGDGAKYTRGRAPLEVVHRETYDSRSAALSREHEIKGLSREAKEALVAGPDGDE